MLNIGRVSNETNADIHMYIEEFILVRDLDTLLYKVELNYIGFVLVFIHTQQYLELSENCS